MKRLAIAVVISALIGASASYLVARKTMWRGHLHSDVRIAVIKSQLSRVENPVVFLGDSIMEMALLPKEICGHPVINAGIGGATTAFLRDNISNIIGGTNPSLVILSIGINDVLTSIELASSRKAYAAILDKIKSPIIVTTITPAEGFDNSAFNGMIESIGKPVIDLSTDGKTTDGVHLTPAGYGVWTKTILDGVQKYSGCGPTSLSRVFP